MSNIRDRSGWIRPDRGGACELPIHAQGRIFLLGAGRPDVATTPRARNRKTPAAGRAHGDALRPACAANCPAGR